MSSLKTNKIYKVLVRLINKERKGIIKLGLRGVLYMRCYKVTTGRTSWATNWKTLLKCVHFWKTPTLEDMAWALLLGDLIYNLKSCHIESMRTRQFKRKFYHTWKKKIIAGSLLHFRGYEGRGDTYRKYVNVSNQVKSLMTLTPMETQDRWPYRTALAPRGPSCPKLLPFH